MGRIWTKILIALRCSTNEAVESVVAHQALRILDQEIGEAEEQIDHGRSSLANLMAKNILASREADQTRERLGGLTRDAMKAIAAGDDGLALLAAARIGKLELLLIEDTRIAQEYARSIDSLRQALESNEEKLRSLKQQLEVAHTTDIVQQAQASLSGARRDTSVHLQVVADALDAIRQRQLETAAHLQAQEELCTRDQDLERRLRDASIISDHSSAPSVLGRIKACMQTKSN